MHTCTPVHSWLDASYLCHVHALVGGAPIMTMHQKACTWQERGISPLLESLPLLLMPPLPWPTVHGSSTVHI